MAAPPNRRRHGRRHRRRQHGLPGPQDRETQRRLQPDARPAHAASVIGAMTKAVRIPVTVKMRAGWNDGDRNAPTLAKMVEDAGAAAIAVHGRTAAQSYSGSADWDLVGEIADGLTIPVFGSGDCIEPEQVIERMARRRRRARRPRRLRNPWILSQAADLAAGGRRATSRSRMRAIPARLHRPSDDASASANRRVPPHVATRRHRPPRHRAPPTIAGSSTRFARWAVYTKGLDNGSHLRTAINSAELAVRVARHRRSVLLFAHLPETAVGVVAVPRPNP